MAGEFDQLLPCKIMRPGKTDVEFPVSSISWSVQQDLVEHKYVGVDGANLEATGRGPQHIECVVPLFNGIFPGKNERWGVLYPTTFRNLIRAVSDRSDCIFQHPELDQIPCRPQSAAFRMVPEHRDGVELTLTLVETLKDFDESIIAAGDSYTNADLGGTDLDASHDDLKKLIPTMPELGVSIESLLNQIQGIADTFTVETHLAYGTVDRLLYHLNATLASLDRAKNALTWPVRDALEKQRSALYTLRQQPPFGRPVRVFRVRAETTLANIVAQIPTASLTDIVKLNPGIMSSPTVKENTLVRYFAA